MRESPSDCSVLTSCGCGLGWGHHFKLWDRSKDTHTHTHILTFIFKSTFIESIHPFITFKSQPSHTPGRQSSLHDNLSTFKYRLWSPRCCTNKNTPTCRKQIDSVLKMFRLQPDISNVWGSINGTSHIRLWKSVARHFHLSKKKNEKKKKRKREAQHFFVQKGQL